MTVTLKTEFDAVLEPLGKDAAEFFLAASLYHAQKISFAAAAALACLSFYACILAEFALPFAAC